MNLLNSQRSIGSRNLKLAIAALGVVLTSGTSNAATDSSDLLIKFRSPTAVKSFSTFATSNGSRVQKLGTSAWVRVKMTNQMNQKISIDEIRSNPEVLAVQPNYKMHLLENYQLKSPELRAKLAQLVSQTNAKNGAKNAGAKPTPIVDNPAIPLPGAVGTGADPDFSKQWGMNDIGLRDGLTKHKGEGVIVAVIDTGVDYTHPDLIDNLWRNPGETGKDAQGRDKATNGIDDDGNGYIDDTIGWDFATNDNKPFDLSVDPIQILMGGGNPGHGTHCAGNVAARGDNGIGVEGVAPMAKIMAMRFLTEKGEGDTAGAIQAIDYAVKNGAKILSNSWGSEGDDPAEAAKNQALKDSIKRAEDAGVLFVAAAGNGHSGAGYDNDSDPKPGVPASYDNENIVSVAAIAANDTLGAFSNWGARTVDIAAPGVVVYSTTVGGKYSDTVIDMYGIKATWDGTSMAAPHVAGAAALYLSAHPGATTKQIKDALITSAKPLSILSGKIVSGGKLNITNLMK